MKALKFTLSGKQAMFKKPEFNTYFYFTYGQIHKPALLGILGAILGYGGYNRASMDKTAVFPEYYNKLREVKVSICPGAPKGCFHKKIISFNNSVGYASAEQGGNLIVKEQWLEDPSFDIYLLLDCGEAGKAAKALKEQRCEYMPYLGKNDHMADITEVEELELKEVEKPPRLDCLFPEKLAELAAFDFDTEKPFKYQEILPFSLSEETNLYEMEKFLFTNLQLETIKTTAYRAGGKDIVFY